MDTNIPNDGKGQRPGFDLGAGVGDLLGNRAPKEQPPAPVEEAEETPKDGKPVIGPDNWQNG
ncbi:hypothetical protein K7472_08360 [Streptomyces sp. PTM05]|uniref:Uncharacterized protein n=1 Tax=Streptantibioticus parmotrematis TaxID=2873249 RepID=A0ABS7QNV3_9ACTN|nr:hypothetical protein [Streptantibioticus parmotrematis]MBY8884859.1 hypothetical protein [Streptantibioticus parmotrematis]